MYRVGKEEAEAVSRVVLSGRYLRQETSITKQNKPKKKCVNCSV